MLCECGCGLPTTVSKYDDARHGYIKGEPKRFRQGHRLAVQTVKDAWEKLIRPKLVRRVDCLLCDGVTKDARGYGSVVIGGRGGDRVKCHRIAYEAHYGVAPGDRFVMHSCDTPSCCNPYHLSLGSAADNSADMAAKGRSYRGSKHFAAKLRPSDVADIMARRLAGEKLKDIAARYGVHLSTVSSITNGYNWKHVHAAALNRGSSHRNRTES